MRPSTFDPTAGERARAIVQHPETAQPIPDPTDPRWGELDLWQQAGSAQMIVDPTDPACAETVV
jgi:hypothetical protein